MNTRSYCTICHTSANDPGPRKLTQNILDKSLQRCDQTQIVIELSMLSFNQQPEMALQAHFEAQHVGLPPQQQPVISSSVSRAYVVLMFALWVGANGRCIAWSGVAAAWLPAAFFVASLPQSPPADLGQQALSTPRAIGSAVFGAGGALTLTAVGPPAIKAPWTLRTCTSTIDALDGLAKNCVDGNGKALEHSGEKCSRDLLGEDPWTSTCNYKIKKKTL